MPVRVVAAVVVAFLIAQAGLPKAFDWLLVLVGPVLLAVIGRRLQLKTLPHWTAAALVAVFFGSLVEILVGSLFPGAPSVPTTAGNRPAAEAPDTATLGFGTRLSGCDLSGIASTFRADEPIHAVIEFVPPPLPVGGTTTITLERNDKELVDHGGTITAREPLECAVAEWGVLEPGRYRMEALVRPGRMPPVTGEFEVVP